MENHKFIFICGLHRSGTSLLFRSLREHPEISGFLDTDSPENEGMHLQTVYQTSGTYGGAGMFGFSPEAHLTELSDLVTDFNRNKLFQEWGKYWDLRKPYLLEKSPPNIIRTRFLQSIFPNSYFIILIRHPVAVSYATRAWYRKFRIFWRRFNKIFEHWIVCHEILLSDINYLKRVLPIKYEDFVVDPENVISRIYLFLGLGKYPVTQKIRPNVNDKYFSLWDNDLDHFFLKWLRIKTLDKYGDYVTKFGYNLHDLSNIDTFEFFK